MAETDVLATLVAKDQIRELALLYSRAIDRQDLSLLRTLYTHDGHDKHGDLFDGSADDFCVLLAESMPKRIRYSGHHVCNHLISVDGDRGEGEVYALAYHTVPGKEGGWEELLMAVRYLDQYRREEGRWRFARRNCTYDMSITRPAPEPQGPVTAGAGDESYAVLTSRIFARGARA